MKRLCFIGNSHLGALHKAWAQFGAEYAAVSAEYFPARKAATRLLNVVDSEGVATALDGIAVLGEKDIAIDDHDVFIIVALGFSVVPLVDLYRKYRTDSHASGTAAHLLSEGCFEAAARGLLEGSVAARTAALLARMTDKPVFIVGQARPSEHVLLKPEGLGAAFLEARQTGDEESLDCQYRRLAECVVGENIRFIDQPPETLAGALFTRGAHGVADPYDNGETSSFSVGDFWHMNVRYGKAALKSILERLGCTTTARPLVSVPSDVLRVDPRSKSVDGPARVVLYDSQKACFTRKEIIDAGQVFELRLDELDEHLDYKYKIQSLDGDGKWIDTVPYERVVQERTSEDGLKYMFFPRRDSNRLVVVFQAINRKPGYNYVGTLSGLPANRLYIKDDYGDDPSTRSSYYLGPDRSSTIADAVQRLIVRVAEGCGADLRQAIFCGSSKGGFAALYHAHLSHAGHVVAGGPQVLLGDFLNSRSESSVHPPILRYLAGDNSDEAVTWANGLLFDVIGSAGEPYPRLHIHVGRHEPHYTNHVMPLVEYLSGKGIAAPTLDLGEYETHTDLAEHFPAYLRSAVSGLLNNAR